MTQGQDFELQSGSSSKTAEEAQEQGRDEREHSTADYSRTCANSILAIRIEFLAGTGWSFGEGQWQSETAQCGSDSPRHGNARKINLASSSFSSGNPASCVFRLHRAGSMTCRICGYHPSGTECQCFPHFP